MISKSDQATVMMRLSLSFRLLDACKYIIWNKMLPEKMDVAPDKILVSAVLLLG